MTVLEAIEDLKLFASHFSGESWAGWRACLRVVFGLPLSPEELKIYRACTARTSPPDRQAREAWLVVGRRGGKSMIAALLAVYLAVFRDYTGILGPGERGVVMVIAADRRQARVVFRYVRALLEVPLLRALVGRETQELIDLRNNVSIEVHTASYRTVRGYTVVAGVLDEVAFWRSEDSAEPDVEIVNALRPAMATVPGALLLGISSPYARRGVLWRAFSHHYGKEGDPVLVWQAPSRVMNPLLSEGVIDAAYHEDEAAARSEWDAEFRQDLESLLDAEAIERCVAWDRLELPPASGLSYVAFVDPSGGRRDAFTLAIGHREGEGALVDVVRAWEPPLNPEGVVAEVADLLSAYRVHKVTGDRYGGEWPREAFRRRGVLYEVCEHPKSDLYLELVSYVNSGRVLLPDDAKLLRELRALERRRGPSGKDRVDHPPAGRDDRANAVAGVTAELLRKERSESLAIKF